MIMSEFICDAKEFIVCNKCKPVVVFGFMLGRI